MSKISFEEIEILAKKYEKDILVVFSYNVVNAEANFITYYSKDKFYDLAIAIRNFIVVSMTNIGEVNGDPPKLDIESNLEAFVELGKDNIQIKRTSEISEIELKNLAKKNDENSIMIFTFTAKDKTSEMIYYVDETNPDLSKFIKNLQVLFIKHIKELSKKAVFLTIAHDYANKVLALPKKNKEQNKPLAIWSLILGILSWITCGIAVIPSLIVGHIAHSKIKKDGDTANMLNVTVGLVLTYSILTIIIIKLLSFLR